MTERINNSDRVTIGKLGRFVVPSIVISGIAVCCWYGWSTRHSVAPEAEVDQSQRLVGDRTTGTSPRPETTDSNPGPEDQGARFVGSQACASCHTEYCESLAHTAHGQSLNEIDLDVEPPDADFSVTTSARRYRVYRQGKELRHREYLLVDGEREVVLAEYPMRYIIGSGTHARSYLVEVGEYLVESPLSWYVNTGRWDLSPGYESENSSFGRPINHECLFCHTGRVDAIAGARTHLKVSSLKIDCERCHGPGSSHVELRSTGQWDDSQADLTIVNPARLSREKNEAVCAQCHLNGDAVVNRKGKQLRDYRPGDSIRDLCIHYSLQNSTTALTIVGHAEELHRSQCYRQSETLTCITCHSPHAKLNLEDRLSHYRQSCLVCHETKPCGMEISQRLAESASDSCVTCHMPKRPSEVPHLAATQHEIRIHRSQIGDAPSGIGTLIPLDELSDLDQIQQDRYLGLAYLELSLKDGHPTTSNAYRQKARDMLERVLNDGLSDADVLVGLAQTYQRRDLKRSIALAEEALNLEQISFEQRVRALSAISDSRVALLETNEAIPAFEQLTTMRRQSADWYRLGACRLRAGDLTGALQAARQAAQIRPDLPNHHALLAEIFKQSGRSESAKAEEQFEKWLKDAAKVPQHKPALKEKE